MGPGPWTAQVAKKWVAEFRATDGLDYTDLQGQMVHRFAMIRVDKRPCLPMALQSLDEEASALSSDSFRISKLHMLKFGPRVRSRLTKGRIWKRLKRDCCKSIPL